MYHRIDLIGSQSLVYKKGEAIDPALQPVGQTLTNNIEGEIENQQHDKQKRRNGCVATGENSVDLHGAGVLPTFMAFHHR